MKTITIVDFDRDDRELAALEKKIDDMRRTPEQTMNDTAINEVRQWAIDQGLPDATATEQKRIKNELKAKKIHGADGIKLKTTNGTTSYPFADYINLDDGRFGISYKSKDGTILDRFEDGIIFLKKDGVQILKAKCPKI
jgi:hypothetical protein